MCISCWYIAWQLKTLHVLAIFEFHAETTNKTFLDFHCKDVIVFVQFMSQFTVEALLKLHFVNFRKLSMNYFCSVFD